MQVDAAGVERREPGRTPGDDERDAKRRPTAPASIETSARRGTSAGARAISAGQAGVGEGDADGAARAVSRRLSARNCRPAASVWRRALGDGDLLAASRTRARSRLVDVDARDEQHQAQPRSRRTYEHRPHRAEDDVGQRLRRGHRALGSPDSVRSRSAAMAASLVLCRGAASSRGRAGQASRSGCVERGNTCGSRLERNPEVNARALAAIGEGAAVGGRGQNLQDAEVGRVRHDADDVRARH